ncbi:alpha/beta fold hydrolase [Kribbella sp. NPDC050820]|uniref:alpha/beta fold hydrolase n=1 Tax=Kribbella sp. NPDC050820 TaxID=3155408 RepID=UPI00341164ED
MIASLPVLHRLSPPAARTALVLHGLEDVHTSWYPVARALGRGWSCVSAELPWCAGNDYGWRWDASPGGWIARVLARLDQSPDLVVAHSFAANAVLELMAGDREPQIQAALLLSPFFHRQTQRATWQTWDSARAAFERQIRDGIAVRLRAGIRADDLELVVSRTLDRVGADGFVAVFDEYLRSARLDLRLVVAPVAVVVGAEERARAGECAALAAALPNARLVVEPDQDHYLHLADPGRVAVLCHEISAWKGVSACS